MVKRSVMATFNIRLFTLGVLLVIGCSATSANILKDDLKKSLIELLTNELAEDGATVAKRSKPSSCKPKYENMGSSTMCLYHDSNQATNRGVSSSDRRTILSAHNLYRSGVNPTAKNMEKMYWDDEIAVIAQKWANTCPDRHDTNANRKVPGYGIWIGQNLAWGYGNWEAAIAGWHSEVEFFKYGQDINVYLNGDYGKIGHYTQVVRDIAARIGCGYALCGSSRTYVCNYAHGNNIDWGKPYLRGRSCADCPGRCTNNLCDCGGKICLNGGKLDPETCSCSCKGLYIGDQCEKLNCPSADAGHCGQPRPYGYPDTSYCRFSNVPIECPFMCKLCTRGGSSSNNGNSGNNGGNGGSNGGNSGNNGNSGNSGNNNSGNNGNNANGGNSGDEAADCPLFDAAACGTQWPQSYCAKFINVPQECPIMCGRCKEKCPGKGADYCKNKGQLDGDTCSCKCTLKFRGTRCEKMKPEYCPALDGYMCETQWPPSYCNEYSNVPKDCPIMCGICDDKCPGKGRDYCKNKGKLDGDTCTCKCKSEYKGARCDKLKSCPPSDTKWACKHCFTANDCFKFSNVAKMCPHLCGLC